MSFAVLLEQYSAKPLREAADILHLVLKTPLIDAKVRSAKIRGIVAEELDRTQAEAIARMLAAVGRPTRIVPQAEVFPAASPRRVQRLTLDPEGVSVFWNFREPCETFPWSAVQGLGAGLVFVKKIEQWEEPVGMSKEAVGVYEMKTADYSGIEPTCLLALRTPAGQACLARLRGGGLNYREILPESDQLNPHERFRLVIARLDNAATSAAVTPQTVAVLQGSKGASATAPDPHYPNDEEHEAHLRWQVSGPRVT